MRRRTAFAAPLVVIVSCQRPLESSPPTVASGPTADATPPDAWITPRLLVDHLEPLMRESTFAEACAARKLICNPPPPQNPPPAPEPPAPITQHATRVLAFAHDGSGARACVLDAGGGADRSWRAVFVTRSGAEIERGQCRIEGYDYREIECVAQRPPEELVDAGGDAYPVVLVPPPELVARVDEERRNWKPPSPPAAPPPPTITARVIHIEVQSNDTVITVSAGSDDGVTKDWQTRMLRGDSSVPLANGACTIIRVGKRETACRTHLTPDKIQANSHVRLEPPP